MNTLRTTYWCTYIAHNYPPKSPARSSKELEPRQRKISSSYIYIIHSQSKRARLPSSLSLVGTSHRLTFHCPIERYNIAESVERLPHYELFKRQESRAAGPKKRSRRRQGFIIPLWWWKPERMGHLNGGEQYVMKRPFLRLGFRSAWCIQGLLRGEQRSSGMRRWWSISRAWIIYIL